MNMGGYTTTELLPGRICVCHSSRGVWRYVFNTPGDARRAMFQAQFAPKEDWLTPSDALTRLEQHGAQAKIIRHGNKMTVTHTTTHVIAIDEALL